MSDYARLSQAILETTVEELKSPEVEALIRDSKPVYTASYAVFMQLAKKEMEETIGFLEGFRVKCAKLEAEKKEWEKERTLLLAKISALKKKVGYFELAEQIIIFGVMLREKRNSEIPCLKL